MTTISLATGRRGLRTAAPAVWLPIAAILVGTGWGSNQFTPMLLVYSHALGLGTGTLEALAAFPVLLTITALLALSTATLVFRRAAD